jgi:LPXTG-motif cell wall-anchored protein
LKKDICNTSVAKKKNLTLIEKQKSQIYTAVGVEIVMLFYLLLLFWKKRRK